MSALSDQVINAVTAQALHADACRNHPVVGWVVMRDQPQPGRFIARLVTDAPTPYVLPADTLAEIHAQLPSGLVRSDRQPAEPPDLARFGLRGSKGRANGMRRQSMRRSFPGLSALFRNSHWTGRFCGAKFSAGISSSSPW